jgi:hypothetical protein
MVFELKFRMVSSTTLVFSYFGRFYGIQTLRIQLLAGQFTIYIVMVESVHQ